MKTVLKSTLLAAAAAVVLPLAASAGTITLSKTHSSIFGDPALYDVVTIGGDTMANMNVYAGGFHVTSSTSESFIAWCIDLAENLNLPNDDYLETATPFTDAVTTKLSQLFTGFVADIDTGVEAAAFQVSVWELISDVDVNLSLGTFQLLSNDAVRDTANDYLTGLSAFDPNYDLSFFLAAGTQDLMTGSPSPVPLPATGLMLLAGLGALGMRARKRG